MTPRAGSFAAPGVQGDFGPKLNDVRTSPTQKAMCAKETLALKPSKSDLRVKRRNKRSAKADKEPVAGGGK